MFEVICNVSRLKLSLMHVSLSLFSLVKFSIRRSGEHTRMSQTRLSSIDNLAGSYPIAVLPRLRQRRRHIRADNIKFDTLLRCDTLNQLSLYAGCHLGVDAYMPRFGFGAGPGPGVLNINLSASCRHIGCLSAALREKMY